MTLDGDDRGSHVAKGDLEPRIPLALAELTTPALAAGALMAGSLVLHLVYLVWRFGVDAPVLDQWSLVADMQLARSGDWTFADLWRSHNGHRILLPRLILVPLALVTGWNTRIEMALILLVALAMYVVLAWRAKDLLGGSANVRYGLALGALGWIVFSLSQWENWLWGIQVCVFLAVGLPVACLATLTGRRFDASALGLSFLLATLATVSQAPGLMAFPVGAVVIASRWREASRSTRVVAVAWLVLAVTLVGAYFVPAPGDSSSLSDPAFLAAHPVQTLVFSLTVVGAPVVSFSGSAWPPTPSLWAPVVGGLGVLVTALLVWPLATRRRGSRDGGVEALFALAACAFGLAVVVLVTLGRVSMGPSAAMASRYMTLMTPFWAGHVILVIARGWPSSDRGAIAARLWLGVILLGFTASSASSLDSFPDRHGVLAPARLALAAGGPSELLSRLHPELGQVVSNTIALRRMGLSVFRESAAAATRPMDGGLTDFRQELRPLSATPATLAPGEIFRLSIELRNPTTDPWYPPARSVVPVNLSYQWLDFRTGLVAVQDGRRTSLPAPLAAGESVVLELVVEAPETPGSYLLRVSAVQEGIDWFTSRGAQGVEAPVRVVERQPSL